MPLAAGLFFTAETSVQINLDFKSVVQQLALTYTYTEYACVEIMSMPIKAATGYMNCTHPFAELSWSCESTCQRNRGGLTVVGGISETHSNA